MINPVVNGTHDKKPKRNWRDTLYEIIFGTETTAGKYFDIILIIIILSSVLVVILDSDSSINRLYGDQFYLLEWFFTILFTIEYFLRLISARHVTKYAFSFFGFIDLLAILPTYISIFFPGSQVLIVIRILRLLRIFRVLKLIKYLDEADLLVRALYASRRKIIVFLFAVLNLVVIMGSMMYVVEGGGHGFNSIPQSIYWAIITLTTVGYGDIVPTTGIGRAVASMIMITGYGIIAVPTGIVTVEISKAERRNTGRICPQCGVVGHDTDAGFCKYCGSKL